MCHTLCDSHSASVCAAAASTVCTWTSRRRRGSRRRACAPSARAGSASGVRCSAWARWARRSACSSSAASTCGGRSTRSRPPPRHLPLPLTLPRLSRPRPSPLAPLRHTHSLKRRHRHRCRRVLRAPSWPAEVSCWHSVNEFIECFGWCVLTLFHLFCICFLLQVRRTSSGSGSSAPSDGDEEGTGRENAADDSGIGSNSRRIRSRETKEGFLLIHMVSSLSLLICLRIQYFSPNLLYQTK